MIYSGKRNKIKFLVRIANKTKIVETFEEALKVREKMYREGVTKVQRGEKYQKVNVLEMPENIYLQRFRKHRGISKHKRNN